METCKIEVIHRVQSMAINSKGREPNPLSTFNSNWKSQPISRIPPASATMEAMRCSLAFLDAFVSRANLGVGLRNLEVDGDV
jgi:hypothetical protein